MLLYLFLALLRKLTREVRHWKALPLTRKLISSSAPEAARVTMATASRLLLWCRWDARAPVAVDHAVQRAARAPLHPQTRAAREQAAARGASPPVSVRVCLSVSVCLSVCLSLRVWLSVSPCFPGGEGPGSLSRASAAAGPALGKTRSCVWQAGLTFSARAFYLHATSAHSLATLCDMYCVFNRRSVA